MDVIVTAPEPERLATLIAAAPKKDGKPIGAGLPGTESLNEAIRSLGELAQRAVEHWFRIVQWRTNRWPIGRRRGNSEAESSTSLFSAVDDRRVAGGSTRIVVWHDHPLTEGQWTDIESTLAEGLSSPIFYQLYFDGQEHFVGGEYRRAVIDFAVACEVLLKTLVERNTPSALFAPAKKYLLRAPAHVLLNRFLPSLVDPQWVQGNRDVVKRLKDLFEARNHVVHAHRHRTLSRADCTGFMDATKRLLDAGSRP
ncbi:MAG: hypothetical protein ABW110_01165 [Steroidobacteraceae bacterium]